MYVARLNRYFMEIPKTATHSVKAAAVAAFGDAGSHAGHRPTSDALAALGRSPEIVRPAFTAVIREPWDRLTSGMNYRFGNPKHAERTTLDDAVAAALGTEDRLVFAPQTSWFDVEVGVELAPFERLAEVIRRHFGVDAPHENPSRRRWTADEVRAHPRAPALERHMADDFALHEEAMAWR